jgi:hypothetical protein
MGGLWTKPDPADAIRATVERLGGDLFPGCGCRTLWCGDSYFYIGQDRELIDAIANVHAFCADTATLESLIAADTAAVGADTAAKSTEERDLVLNELERLARTTSRSGAIAYMQAVHHWAGQPVSDGAGDAPTADRDRCWIEATAFASFLTECDSSGILAGPPSPDPLGSPRIGALAVKQGKVINRAPYARQPERFAATYNWLLCGSNFEPKIFAAKSTAVMAAGAAHVAQRKSAEAALEPLKKAARDAIDTPGAEAAFAAYRAASRAASRAAAAQLK